MDLSAVVIILLILLIGGLLYFVYSLKNQLSQTSSYTDVENQFREIQTDMKNQFREISNDVLLNNQQQFINLAKETFDKIVVSEKADLSTKQNAFIAVIDPIKDALTQFQSKISELEKERTSSYSDLRRQVSDMMLSQQAIQKTTAELNKALSAPPSSGQWGEMQLRRTVELSGMLPYCDFLEQQVTDEPYSRLRPDMIIRLPGDKNIIVDAKTSLNDYIRYTNSGDISALDEHIRHIKKHIRDLSQKSYWNQFSHTPEFVLMFLPGESFFSTAIKHDPSLLEFGIKEKVIITTPLTLIAVLKAIACTWRQEAISSNAKKIGEAGKLLQSKLDKLFEVTEAFNKNLYRTTEQFDKLNSFIRKEIMPAANKLKLLGSETPELVENKLQIEQQLLP